jgi:hypothetical protein
VREPTFEELRQMLPGCLDCPVETTDPGNHHAQMREVCIGCFLEGPHKRNQEEIVAGGEAAQLVIDLRRCLDAQVQINHDLVSRISERTAQMNRAEELLASCRDLSEQRRVALDTAKGERLGYSVACRELNSDLMQARSLLADALQAFAEDEGRGVAHWRDEVTKLLDRRVP